MQKFLFLTKTFFSLSIYTFFERVNHKVKRERNFGALIFWALILGSTVLFNFSALVFTFSTP